MLLPPSRGPLTAALFAALLRDDDALLPCPPTRPTSADPVADDDLQLALWVCFELHYQGFADVRESWEWHPGVIALRGALETTLLAALRRDVPAPVGNTSVAERLQQIVDDDDGPSLARSLQRGDDIDRFREVVIHRSMYKLKEADPYTWVIPRLSGRVKAAFVEIQADEYGSGNVARMHSELFRKTMCGLGLSDSYGDYVASVPAVTLAISNVMSMFGLRRELRGALLGHFAAYEMTSSAPCRRYAIGLRRLGGTDEMCDFYDAHVVADALHEQLVMHDVCSALAASEPQLTQDIYFGAAVCLYIEKRFGEHVLAAWETGESSLRSELVGPVERVPVSV